MWRSAMASSCGTMPTKVGISEISSRTRISRDRRRVDKLFRTPHLGGKDYSVELKVYDMNFSALRNEEFYPRRVTNAHASYSFYLLFLSFSLCWNLTRSQSNCDGMRSGGEAPDVQFALCRSYSGRSSDTARTHYCPSKWGARPSA